MKKSSAILLSLFISMNSSLSLADDANKTTVEDYTSRFILNNKGEAFDRETELTWQRCSAGTTFKESAGCVGSPKLMTLADAIDFASQKGEGWRVPTIEELYSLVEHDQDNPAINTAVFPSVKGSSEGAPYWTVTAIEDLPMLTYFVDFMSGRVDGHTQGFSMAVRLVRSKNQE